MTIKLKALLPLTISAFILMSCSGCLPTIRHHTDIDSNSYSKQSQSINQKIEQVRLVDHQMSFSATKTRLISLEKLYDEKLISKEAYEHGMMLIVEDL